MSMQADESRIGRAAVRGGLVGFVAVTVMITALVAAVGGGAEAVGVGVFVGIFGGIGFGGMLAASVSSDRLAKEEKAALGRSQETDD